MEEEDTQAVRDSERREWRKSFATAIAVIVFGLAAGNVLASMVRSGLIRL